MFQLSMVSLLIKSLPLVFQSATKKVTNNGWLIWFILGPTSHTKKKWILILQETDFCVKRKIACVQAFFWIAQNYVNWEKYIKHLNIMAGGRGSSLCPSHSWMYQMVQQSLLVVLKPSLLVRLLVHGVENGFVQHKIPCTFQSLYTLCILYCLSDISCKQNTHCNERSVKNI